MQHCVCGYSMCNFGCLHSGRTVHGISMQSACLTSQGSSMVSSSPAAGLASVHCSACGLVASRTLRALMSMCGTIRFRICIKQLKIQTEFHGRITCTAECPVRECRTRQRLYWLHGYVAEASSLQQIQQFLQQKKVCQLLKGKLDGLGLKWL